MYEENGGYEDGFSQTHNPICNNNNNNNNSKSFSMEEEQQSYQNLEMELQQQMNLEMVHDSSTWQDQLGNTTTFNDHHYNNHVDFTPYPTTPDLLNMFPLPRCSSSSLLPNAAAAASITFSNTGQKSSGFLASLGLLDPGSSGAPVYDPLLPLNLPPQPPFLRELFHSLPNGSIFGSGGVDERDQYQNSDHLIRSGFDNGVFEFTAGEMDCINGKNIIRDGKDTKHYATERHRRVIFSDKFQDLRKLVPQPTKNDRASIVGDAINYINELKRTVNELQGLVEQKRCTKERLKRPKTEEDHQAMDESKTRGDIDVNPFTGSTLRSSWLHRKSKNTEVDVRIIDNEVTVKLVQQKRINCLLFVSKVLDELHLDLHHVAGGLIGDYYSFLFNSKICEGSIVYASAIANKLIEVVDKQYAAIPPTTSY